MKNYGALLQVQQQLLSVKSIYFTKDSQRCSNRSCKGMKLQKDAKAKFQSMKDDAADLCYDAKAEAGIETETETEVEE